MSDEFVELTDDEFKEACERGSEIYQSSVARGFREKHVSPTYRLVSGERTSQLGEIASRAIAKAFGLPWVNSMDTFKKADLPGNIEARLIGGENLSLRVMPNDDDTRRVVGCIIAKGREREPYRLPGWINAKHGKKPEWLRDPHNRNLPVYFVPQAKLHHNDVLRDLLRPRHTPSSDHHLCFCGRYGANGGPGGWKCSEHRDKP